MAIGDNYISGGPKAGLGAGGNDAQNKSEREDLANFISMITRDETPFMSSIGKTKATATLHEWQTDELAAPAFNAQEEGVYEADLTQDSEYRNRLGNSTQIFAKNIEVSGTKRAVDQAGVADEYAYQLKKRGTELRRDVEYSLIHTWQSRAGTGTRRLGGIQAYIDHGNVYDANDGDFLAASSGIGAGLDGSFDGTLDDGTKTTISLNDIDEVMQKIYEEGGKAGKIMVSPKNRREISSQAQAAGNVRREIGDSGKLRQSVDVYMSDFGDVMVVPNYIMGLTQTAVNGPTGLGSTADYCAIVYDPMWFNVATLRPTQEVDVGQKGDSTTGMIVEECTLEVRNPKGWGLILNIGN